MVILYNCSVICDHYGDVSALIDLHQYSDGASSNAANNSKTDFKRNELKTLETLETLSTTRWACRSEAVEAIKTNYSTLLLCLEEMSSATNLFEVRAKVRGLIYQMKVY